MSTVGEGRERGRRIISDKERNNYSKIKMKKRRKKKRGKEKNFSAAQTNK
jgi:hypothetical protein